MDERNFDALPPVDTTAEQDLQVPAPEAGGATPTEKQAAQALEQSPGGFVDPSAGGASPPPVLPPMPHQGATPQTPLSPASTDEEITQLIADDTDLIEKEWVSKAKQIVEQTKHDPFKQNEEITKMKIDYLKKRYGREIKASTD